MAKGDQNFIDTSIDGCNLAELKRVNKHYQFGIAEPRWWQRTEAFRELVREAVHSHFARGTLREPLSDLGFM